MNEYHKVCTKCGDDFYTTTLTQRLCYQCIDELSPKEREDTGEPIIEDD
jgi:hypothetical protein